MPTLTEHITQTIHAMGASEKIKPADIEDIRRAVEWGGISVLAAVMKNIMR